MQVVRVVPRDDLDLSTGPQLDSRLNRAMTLHDGDGLVLDLSDVPFMDCAGLVPVLRARNALGDRFWPVGADRRPRPAA